MVSHGGGSDRLRGARGSTRRRAVGAAGGRALRRPGPVRLRAAERRHRDRLPGSGRRPVLRRVRQDEPEPDRLRPGRVHRPGADARRRRGQQVLLLPARPLDRLGRPGRAARALALGRRLLLRPRTGRRWGQRPQLPRRGPADGRQPVRARRLPALLRSRTVAAGSRCCSSPSRPELRGQGRHAGRARPASTAAGASTPAASHRAASSRGGTSAGRGSGYGASACSSASGRRSERTATSTAGVWSARASFGSPIDTDGSRRSSAPGAGTRSAASRAGIVSSARAAGSNSATPAPSPTTRNCSSCGTRRAGGSWIGARRHRVRWVAIRGQRLGTSRTLRLVSGVR